MTDEEIHKAVLARFDGWIQHSGGPCPVPDKKVCVVLRSGARHIFGTANHYTWAWEEDISSSTNIMSYKVLND